MLPWKSWNFFCLNLRPWKYLKTRQVLQSTWIWCCRYRTEKSWNLISLQKHTYDPCSKMWHWCWRSSRLDSVQHSVTRFTHLSCLLNNLMGLYYSFFIFQKKLLCHCLVESVGYIAYCKRSLKHAIEFLEKSFNCWLSKYTSWNRESIAYCASHPQ